MRNLIAWVATLILLTNSALANDDIVAETVKMSGDVRVRRAGEPNWQKISQKMKFHAGDRAFVGDSGELVIKYLKEDATVKLGARSIFEVTHTLPVNTKLDRKSQLNSNGEDEINRIPEIALDKFLSDYFNSNDVSQTLAPKLGGKERDSGINLEWKVTERGVKAPVGVLNIRALAFPARFTLVLESIPRPQKMFGYLWHLEKNKSTVWSGVGFDSFENVSIPSSGIFVFQAFSEDAKYKTAPIVVRSERLDLASGDNHILPRFLRYGDTVYVP